MSGSDAEDRRPRGWFRCTGAKSDITPVMPTALAGYSERPATHHAVASSLEANAVLLECDDARVLFISADLLFIGRELLDAIEARARHYGLSPDCVVTMASHTHFAPSTDATKTAIGSVDDRYLQHCKTRLTALVDDVMSATTMPAWLHASRVHLPLNVSRRRRWKYPTLTSTGVAFGPTIVMAPAPDETCDQNLDAIVVRDQADRPLAVMWKYACHPVSFPATGTVSAEFPGHARARIRSAMGRDLPVVFWQGFAGDVRPRTQSTTTPWQYVRSAVLGPTFGLVAQEQWTAWADAIADALCTAVHETTGRVSPALRAATARIPVRDLIDLPRHSPWFGRSMAITRIALGTELELLGVAAEVCSPYLDVVSGPSRRRSIATGCVGDVFGYLPSEAQAAEGGYEGTGFFVPFGLEGTWKTGFERLVRGAVGELRSDG